MKNKFRLFTVGSSQVLLALLAINANATLMLDTGLVGGSGDVDNVLFNCDFGCINGPNTTVTGFVNTTTELVDFIGNEALMTPAIGQARIEAVDGAFTDIMWVLQNDTLGFEKVQFNIDAAANGFADIILTDQFGTDFSFLNQALDGAGENWFTGYSLDNQVIVKATIAATVAMTAISDLQQVRLGLVERTTSLPEPGTLGLLLMGFFATLAARIRKKQLAI